ncbi:MAG: branched-chain amino acid ABC transporter permease [Anaerolineae bacterium]
MRPTTGGERVAQAMRLLTALVVVGVLLYGPFQILRSGKYGPENWVAFVVFGLAQGSLYALIALGYTLVYGILRMINFAHGEIFMSGAFTGYFAADALNRAGWLGDPWRVAASLALITAAAAAGSTTVAVLLERIAYRPLRRAPRLVPLITAIGASLFLQYTFSGLFGSGLKKYPDVKLLKGSFAFHGVNILKVHVIVFVAAVTLMTALYLFVQHTRVGRAMRAVSEDKDTAALMGIDVDGVIVQTFMLGGALAGVAGVLHALIYGQVVFNMGFQPGLKAFTAAVLGGIGNVPGAMLGGLFLGVVESLGPALFLEGLGIPAPHQLKDAIAFSLLVLVLVFRPTGILGERVAEKRA